MKFDIVVLDDIFSDKFEFGKVSIVYTSLVNVIQAGVFIGFG